MSKVISKKSKKHNFNPIKVEPKYDEVLQYDNPEVVATNGKTMARDDN